MFNKISKKVIIFIISLWALQVGLFANYHQITPSGFVNDFANIIKQEHKHTLNSLLAELEQKTSVEIAVATIKTMGKNTDIETYANKLFNKWKIGKEKEDNGLLFLIALHEKKARIEVGYGLEYLITDGLSGEILDNYVIPYFEKGLYSDGIYNGVSTLTLIISKDKNITLTGIPKEKPENKNTTQQDNIFGIIIFLIIIILLMIFLGPSRFFEILFWILLFSGFGGRGGGSYGNNFGSFGGGFGSFGGGISGGGGTSRGW